MGTQPMHAKKHSKVKASAKKVAASRKTIAKKKKAAAAKRNGEKSTKADAAATPGQVAAMDDEMAGVGTTTSGGSSGSDDIMRTVNFVARAKTDGKAMDAVRKSINRGLTPDVLGALLTHCAGRGLAPAVELLLQNSAPMTSPDLSQQPGRMLPLQLAASRGHVNVCRILVQAGCDRTGALEASQDLAKLGAVFAEEKNAIQALFR
eukprot:CAMPEP_0206615588 /NCGR_PEP_ID=MMETSP0325_2-20121206/58335_1 /ASSEMBLY_ACC=CAM_ASM_000347 /TAXON_ID=2866 /ORGANISM="Crypthecodinium cohnii, Strain Seligo" /LENGTH=205 /DNA_ID=CAMNT_0054136821 /DNA_START=155 /DNA_END=772 /DNA_ORIENTATION=+